MFLVIFFFWGGGGGVNLISCIDHVAERLTRSTSVCYAVGSIPIFGKFERNYLRLEHSLVNTWL